ncbi:MAG TPA: flagellar biosynthetic protein FliO [Minicystis sp.]|nr:flagellar biosynthetic protein FliO [Polyangiaceae bacterium]HVY45358.1 flagellar biosynthetic protein FliO [Minicystis sp.]
MTIGFAVAFLAGTAFADPAEQAVGGGAPETAEVAAMQAPDASVSSTGTLRPWLRATKPASAVIAAPPEEHASPWRAFAVLLVLGGLCGGALMMRKKRMERAVLPESATRIRVISSARVGPKANAVVAEVGGRVLLLGVTDTSVARLAWLDRDLARKAAETPDAERRSARAPLLSSEPVETADADLEPPPERGMAARFGEVLDRALGVKPAPEFRGNPGVAALLAARVDDVVQTRGTPRTTARMGSSPSVLVEEQVAGLRRQRRRS